MTDQRPVSQQWVANHSASTIFTIATTCLDLFSETFWIFQSAHLYVPLLTSCPLLLNNTTNSLAGCQRFIADHLMAHRQPVTDQPARFGTDRLLISKQSLTSHLPVNAWSPSNRRSVSRQSPSDRQPLFFPIYCCFGRKEVASFWSQNCSKVDAKWFQTGSKMVAKWSENGH